MKWALNWVIARPGMERSKFTEKSKFPVERIYAPQTYDSNCELL